jgi:hypothetical protein
MPIASVLGFVVIGPRARFDGKDMVFLVWPVCWLLYTMLRGALLKPVFSGFGQTPSHYPYSFLNVGHVPIAEVIGSILVITVMLIALGLAYIYGDRWLERLAHARTSTTEAAFRPNPPEAGAHVLPVRSRDGRTADRRTGNQE